LAIEQRLLSDQTACKHWCQLEAAADATYKGLASCIIFQIFPDPRTQLEELTGLENAFLSPVETMKFDL